MPLFLSISSMNGLLPTDRRDSAVAQAIVQQLSPLDQNISAMVGDKLKRERQYLQLLDACRLYVDDVYKAHAVMTVDPDCGSFRRGRSDDVGLNATTLPIANQAIDRLKAEDDMIADLTRRITDARAKRAAVEAEFDAATVNAVKTRYVQIELFLILMRYGSIGAIGAIGFNVILRLGVFDREAVPRGERPAVVGIVFSLIGCMLVAAILAIIFVPRLTNIADSSGAYTLTAQGVSCALAAGLAGDIALRAVRKILGPAG
jgi:hypothetical protein